MPVDLLVLAISSCLALLLPYIYGPPYGMKVGMSVILGNRETPRRCQVGWDAARAPTTT
jgi:hypothetical protein